MEKQNNTATQEPLNDKAFSQLIFTSIFAIVICIVLLCSSTYAWFTITVPSTQNQIKAAESCLLTVTVTDSGEPLADIENGVLLEEGKTYTVTLTLPNNSASGYCKIVTEANAEYFTEYIARHDEPEAKTVEFTITVEETQNVSFIPRWGIYSGTPDVMSGEELCIRVL